MSQCGMCVTCVCVSVCVCASVCVYVCVCVSVSVCVCVCASRVTVCTLSRSSNIAGCAMSINTPSKRDKEHRAWATGSTLFPQLHSPKWRMDHSHGPYSTGLGLRHQVKGIFVASSSLVRNSRARHHWTPSADMLPGTQGVPGAPISPMGWHG